MAKKSGVKHHSNSHKDSGDKPYKEGRRRKQHRRSTNVVEINPAQQHLDTAYAAQRILQPLMARTPAQQRYISAIRTHCLTFGIGPAGTGKSYCAAALAAEALEAGQIERIILTRPAVEAGEQLGFLPGAVDEKFAVYIEAFRDILNERLGAGTVDYCIRHGRIVAAPLAFMRGKTFNSKNFVILDEAQNTSVAQMKMFLTRLGIGSKMVISGDTTQIDLPQNRQSGLVDAMTRLQGVRGCCCVHLGGKDIVRHPLVQRIVEAYGAFAERSAPELRAERERRQA